MICNTQKMTIDKLMKFAEKNKCVGYWNPYHDICGNNTEVYIYESSDGKYYKITQCRGPRCENGEEEIFGPKEIEVVTSSGKIYEKQYWMV